MALCVVGLAGWRRLLTLAAAVVVPVAGLSVVLPSAWEPPWGVLFAGALYLVSLGLFTAAVFQVPPARGAAAGVGGFVGGVLVACPVIVVVGLLIGLVDSYASLPSRAWQTTLAPIGAAATAWCVLVVSATTAAETALRHILTNSPVIRGVYALGLALATAAVMLLLVVLASTLLHEKWLWLTGWVVFLAVAQLVPPFLRWRWRFSVGGAAVSLTLAVLVGLGEWLAPGSSPFIAVWVVGCMSVMLINVKTMDLFAHWREVLRRLRTRMQSRRLSVRIEVARR